MGPGFFIYLMKGASCYNMPMPKRKKPSVTTISRFFEEAANEAFADSQPENVPAYTFVFKIWERVCVCAVLNENCDDSTMAVLDGLRIITQKKFKTGMCLICRKDAKHFSWQKAEERVIELLEIEGGEAE